MTCQRGGIVGKTVATCQLEPQLAKRPRHAIPVVALSINHAHTGGFIVGTSRGKSHCADAPLISLGYLVTMICFENDGTNGELGIGISTCESEDDISRELMEVRGRVPMANPQDAQVDAQPGDTTDSNGTSRQH
ncbi:unnamed protein product [Cylicocyclus nassatus]|uniref:Uncharacterized protein n=1 Tax=Cylicocyclus nassatus TaxID=53992 RepID=A0AA36GF12_CYLNA|nr:unnamed protein product [Cylicocyclus nassatus]